MREVRRMTGVERAAILGTVTACGIGQVLHILAGEAAARGLARTEALTLEAWRSLQAWETAVENSPTGEKKP